MPVYSAADFPDFDAKRHPLLKHATPVELTLHPRQACSFPRMVALRGVAGCLDQRQLHQLYAPNQFSSDPRET
jgi:hypothetical protein